MIDFMGKVFCKMGWHDWHLYNEYNGESTKFPIEGRICRKCRYTKLKSTQIIKLSHWE
jgi:hypothetical protein